MLEFDDYDRRKSRDARNERIGKAIRAGADLDTAIITLDAAGALRDVVHLHITTKKASEDFQDWLAEHGDRAATKLVEAQQYVDEVATLRKLVN
ncbi:hypothetical protein [Kutzneria albida]|uniref:Uncharacterized protein n=1 Tax=Kutzneria albida DSM 43870 TaxID=1449976 RepID=W5WJD6_9PSEU|nr:hypothetical protein [Kutzneria albida]AHH98274.1 hypothetical protein KALB_4912 [Kutzneria albida DSM 43870]